MNAHGRRFVRGKALEDDLRSVIVDTILNEGGDGHFSNFIQNARTKIQSDLPPFIILSLKEQKLLERFLLLLEKKVLYAFLCNKSIIFHKYLHGRRHVGLLTISLISRFRAKS